MLGTFDTLGSTSAAELRPTKIPIHQTIPTSSASQQFFVRGWALPRRQGGRLNIEAKEFCLQKFIEGERTGKKYSPGLIADMMRSERDPITKEKVFSAESLMTTTQIKSLMARCSSSTIKKMSDKNTTAAEIIEKLELV